MTTRALWPAIIACALLVGCSVMQPRVERAAKKIDCDGSGPCTVTVAVACTWFHSCEASVDYDIVVVGEKKKVDIEWQLVADAGFEFPDNGIVLDYAGIACKAQGKTRFRCSDNNTGFAVLKYTVNITAPSSAFGPRGVPPIDPWVVNR